jgi:3-hydroxybutyryl-CoA dehydrogenase
MTAIGIVGGGRMGAGIAHVFALHGNEVTVVEGDEQGQQAARGRIAASLERAAERRASQSSSQAIGAITVVGGVADLDPESVLVVEAVPEIAALKVELLGAAERAVSATCILATNTSSLSIGELSKHLAAPERFLGMHFFNPVPISKLVEVVVGPYTAPETTRRAVEWVAELGKSEIVVRDSPGFATSRLGVLLGLEAIRMLEEGVADAEAIDRAMELGYRHPMGPLRSTDLIGLDVRLHIAEYLETQLGERFRPPQLLRDKVARGHLGRKSGQGFYEWS